MKTRLKRDLQSHIYNNQLRYILFLPLPIACNMVNNPPIRIKDSFSSDETNNYETRSLR